MSKVPGLIIQLTASQKGELLICINAESEGRGIDVRLISETRLQRPATSTRKGADSHVIHVIVTTAT